ncbi:MAG: DUF3034 family protein [Wenzhouxiangellaceae bacterium]
MKSESTRRRLAVFAMLVLSGLAQAAGTGQLGTGGVSMFEGSGGGGIVPWATLSGYATREEIDATAFYTRAELDDYRLDVYGASVNFYNRLELSIARQELDLITLGPALGLPGASLEQDVFGAKIRIVGDVVYTHVPQVSLGVQHKRNRDFLIPQLVGAPDDDGTDFYLSAAKLFLAGLGGYNVFTNATLRSTKANETGLLGFGGPGGDSRNLQFEAAAGVFLHRTFAIGAEFRSKSGHLPGLPEDDWFDIFAAWVPNRHVSVTAAYVNFGEIATLKSQDGWYLSLELRP